MNQDVLDMIARLHARLDDVTAVVKSCDEDLEGYAKRLDKIDDQIYLIEVEIEKRIKLAHTDSDEAKADSKENLELKQRTILFRAALMSQMKTLNFLLIKKKIVFLNGNLLVKT